MKKSFTFFFGIVALVFVLSSNTNRISSFVMTIVGDAPNLPATPFDYSDIEFPAHIFNDRDTIIGYGAGGDLDSLVFEFIDNDELVEVTPVSIRIRKKLLTENLRKQAGRPAKV